MQKKKETIPFPSHGHEHINKDSFMQRIKIQNTIIKRMLEEIELQEKPQEIMKQKDNITASNNK